MRLQRVEFDSDEEPVSAVFSMSIDEMALIYNLTGRTSPIDVTNAAGGDQKWGEANDDIASCLSGAFFNRFYDAGVDEVAPKFGIVEIAARKADRG